MNITFVIIVVLTIFMEIVAVFLPNATRARGTLNKCGLDKSPIKVVYEGNARIETYPWIGSLVYKSENTYSTPVILVTLQIVIGSALDIDRLPKTDFRSRARVVLGHNCSRPGIKIKEYAYHPDFTKHTYSSIALIQIETNFRGEDFHPVCPPPKSLDKPQFYVLALSDDCNSSKIKIYKMAYISPDECKTYYRRTQLDMEKMWPTYTICAKALSGKECIWENGAILLLRQDNKWSLIGLGIHGPGCRAPARFLDYVQHRRWLRSSVAGIGKPTITRISKNHIVLRRKNSNVQRFGPCDPEEIREELYTDRTTVHPYPSTKLQCARYNFTIFANLEYSCVVFRVFHFNNTNIIRDIPYIRIDRWCLSPEPICYSFQFMKIDFSVTIWFNVSVTYYVAAYGKEVKLIDRKKIMARVNAKKPLVDQHN